MGMVEDGVEEGKPLVGDGLYSPVATTVLQKIDRHILPVFLTMATLCYLDRWVHPAAPAAAATTAAELVPPPLPATAECQHITCWCWIMSLAAILSSAVTVHSSSPLDVLGTTSRPEASTQTSVKPIVCASSHLSAQEQQQQH
jgi:hypothetical protein